MGKILQSLIFVSVLSSSFGKTVHEQVSEILNGADLIEIAWKADVERVGLRAVKARFEGKEGVEELLSRLRFEDDLPQEPAPEGALISRHRCLCRGTHIIRSYAGEKLLAEISLHHATHLRSEQINDGDDAHLTTDSSFWLNTEIQWDEDIQFLQGLKEDAKPIQSPEPTTASAAVGRSVVLQVNPTFNSLAVAAQL